MAGVGLRTVGMGEDIAAPRAKSIARDTGLSAALSGSPHTGVSRLNPTPCGQASLTCSDFGGPLAPYPSRGRFAPSGGRPMVRRGWSPRSVPRLPHRADARWMV